MNMERIKSFFISKPEAPPLPTHTQRSLTLTRSSSIFREQDMGKAILNLAFSATIGLVVLLFNQGSLMTQVDPPISLCILGIAILIAFSASFLAISLRDSWISGAAEVLEHIGIVSTVVAFFMLMSFLLPSSFQWLVLAACVVSLLGYVIAHVERFCVTDAGVEGPVSSDPPAPATSSSSTTAAMSPASPPRLENMTTLASTSASSPTTRISSPMMTSGSLVDMVPAESQFTIVSDSSHSSGLMDEAKEQIGESTRQEDQDSESGGFRFKSFLKQFVKDAFESQGIHIPSRGDGAATSPGRSRWPMLV